MMVSGDDDVGYTYLQFNLWSLLIIIQVTFCRYSFVDMFYHFFYSYLYC